MQREKIAGWKGSLLVLVLIWAVGLFDRFSLFDALSYDLLVQTIPGPSHQPGVVLVEARPERSFSASGEWKKLIDQLLALKAHRIAFAFPPRFDDPSFLAASPYRENVLIGGWLVRDPEIRERQYIGGIPENYPAWLRERIVPLAPPTEKGIARSQLTQLAVDGRPTPIFSVAAAGTRPDTDRFFINFSDYANELPTFRMDRLLAEGSIAEAFAGKVVLVGVADTAPLHTISIPGRSAPVSVLELHGLATDTLIQDEAVRVFSHGQRMLILALAWSITLALLQPLTLLPGIIAAAVLTTLTIAGSWLLLWLANIWLPVGDLFFVSAWTMLFVFRDKAARENQTLKSLLLNLTARVQSRTAPISFIQADEHWGFVLSLIDQTLSVTRTIVLERIPAEHRVREVKALRCAVTDISEMRRDYERAPYTDAIADGGMIRVDKYLKSVDDSEHQYLVALMFGGEILGFWAFGLIAGEIERSPELPRTVNSIARQVSVLLYQRKLREEIENASSHDWRRYFSDDNIAAFVELNQSIQFLQQRLVTIEQLFRGLGTAAALYDLWGRLVAINEEMSDLLRLAGIPAYGITAADLVRRLTGLNEAEARETMNRLIVERKAHALQLHIAALPERLFLLSIKPLAQADDSSGADSSNPFDLMGILIELVDVSEMHAVIDLKSDVLKNTLLRLEPDLKILADSAQAIAAHDRMSAGCADLGRQIGRSAGEIEHRLGRSAELLAPELDPTRLDRYPIDVAATISRVADGLDAEARNHRVRLRIEDPPAPTLAYADPERLPMLVAAIFGVLFDDAPPDSEIVVRLTLDGGRFVVDFRNAGFGLPQERIDEMFAGSTETTESFAALRRATHALADWRGSIEVRSGIGMGIQVVLRLEVFD